MKKEQIATNKLSDAVPHSNELKIVKTDSASSKTELKMDMSSTNCSY